MRELLKTVIALSFGGSVLALALLAVRYFLRKRLPSTFFYYAWLVVLLRLILPLPGMMPVAPASIEIPTAAISAHDTLPAEVANPVTFEPPAPVELNASADDAPQYQPMHTLPTQPDMQVPEEKSVQWDWNWDVVLVIAWVLGILICLGRYGLCYASFVRSIRRLAIEAEPKDREILRRLASGKMPRLIRSRSVKTPMLVGTLHPFVVIPDRVYSEEMLSNILLHELTHFRRKDILYKWFAVTVYSIHWFNPLMLVIRYALDRDCEMSCDEVLLRRMDTANKKSYGETLLALAEDRVLPGRLVATTFATEKKNLKERLEQIMTYRKMGKTALCLLLCAVLLLCGCAASVGPAKGGTDPTLAEATEPTIMPEAEPTTMPEAAGDDAIHVSNVDELLAAIGPDREIVLAPGEYNLTKAENYSRVGTDWYHWESCFDGHELVLDEVRNLTIRGENAAQTTICTEPRYANVLRFVSGSGITLSNLTVGHTPEQGNCTGGVLYFDSCVDVEVQSAKLYGCGIRGLELQNCQNVHMINSDIYDCSYGCICIWGSYNVLLENNKYYDCHVYDAFEIYSSQEVAIINSEIYNLTGEEWSNLFRTNCTGIYLGGLDVHDNSVASLFECSAPVTLTSSRFQQGQQIMNWLGNGEAPVSADGIELRESDLYDMSMRTVRWTPAPIIKTEAPAVSSDGKIHVTNVDEFLASIDSDTTIFLEPGVYDLSEASNYGSLGGKNYYWQDDYDGPGLVINAVDNLTIEGAGTDQVTIAAKPRYADVISFKTVSNLKLLNFTAGHTEEPGVCVGGVLRFDYCTNTDIQGCSLYGCGVLGVWAESCTNLNVTDTEIYECSNGAVDFRNCTDVTLTGCNIHDNGEPTYYESGCQNVLVDGAQLKGEVLFTEEELQSAVPTNIQTEWIEPPTAGEDGKVHVTNVDEFLAAIAPDTTIYLEPGVYDLSTASGYGMSSGWNDYYLWQADYDGPELVINGVSNLTIEGAGKDLVTIVAKPRYANVLSFGAMSNLKLLNFTAGHSEEPGYCTGGVLSFTYCTNTEIQGCGLYGCGILGVSASYCTDMNVVNTEIYDCSNGAASFHNCQNVALTDCNVHDNGEPTYYTSGECENVSVDGAQLYGRVLTAEVPQSTAASDAQAEWIEAPAAGEDGKVHVTNVDEFLAAIAPDTTIYLEPGVYDLSEAAHRFGWESQYYYWNDSFDGPELVIRGVSNLTIEGAGKDQVSIVAVPRYANVLTFETTSNLKLLNFTAGHSEAPGECTGGVLRFNYCTDTGIQGCGLYGCGILGVSASYCTGLDVVNTEIYECSYGAVSFQSCRDVALTGCDVHDNGEQTYYADANCQNVLIDGVELVGTVRQEQLVNVPTVEAPAAGEDGKVHVTNVDEFLAAIAPNTTIYLEPGVYDLSTAADYGSWGSDYYYWQDNYDGPELVINGASNLTIEGAGKDQVSIVAAPRYANVLRFTNLSGLILRGFTAGHSEAPGECSGGVIQLENVNNTNIEGCGLYGCGILGVTGFDCETLYVTGTEIYDCSSGAAWFYGCKNVRVDYCDVHDIGGREFYADSRCQDVLIDGKPAPTDAPW